MWLASASRARGLRHIAIVIAAAWLAGVMVMFYEQGAGASVGFLYTLIDGLAAIALLAKARRPAQPFFWLTLALIVIMAAQALVRLKLTPADLPTLLMAALNSSFLIMLVLINAFSAVRLIRIGRPDLWGPIARSGFVERIRRGRAGKPHAPGANAAPPGKQDELSSPFAADAPRTFAEYLLLKLFTAIANVDRPEAERLDAPARPESPAASMKSKRRHDEAAGA